MCRPGANRQRLVHGGQGKGAPADRGDISIPPQPPKVRYSDKSFVWRRPDGKGGWIWNRQGVPNALFQAGELTGVVAVTEGEKDALTLNQLEWSAACGEHGAGKDKWKPEYSEQLRGLTVVVFMDNDDIGRAYGAETAAALTVWPQVSGCLTCPGCGRVCQNTQTLAIW